MSQQHMLPVSPQWALKRKTVVFSQKVQFSRRSTTKFLCVKTVSDRVVRHLLAYLSVQKWIVGTSLLCENLTPSKTPISNQYSLLAPQQ